MNCWRITLALDSLGFDGPWVDFALGVAEPTVDEWEAGISVPDDQQIRRLVTLTGYPIGFFYDPSPEPGGHVFQCWADLDDIYGDGTLQ